MARTAAPINAHLTHFVVDGSNIATEGRAVPSLKQLNDAVMAFIEEHPDALITVVVDATFGHRIDKKEVKNFDDAVANNELVTPPAGAVGRGDAFVLSIANKAKAGILSNDSFQEFHGDYGWLFEPGRLIGGKPVPHVGWVFVERLPVRGPKSRQSVKDAKEPARPASTRAARGTGSPLADRPLPVPAAPPPGPAPTAKAKVKRAAAETAAVVAAAAATVHNGEQQASREAVNGLLPFLDFVEHHPIGTGCTVVVESYASHGAYARAGDVLVYVPLRLMGDPPPRSARAALKIGEAVAVVIVGYVPERRSIDAALVSAGDVAARAQPPAAVEVTEPPAPTGRRRSRAKQPTTQPTPVEPAVSEASRRRRTSKAKLEADAGAPEMSAQLESPAAAVPADVKPAATRRTRRKTEPEAPAAVAPEPAPTPEAKPVRKRTAKKADAKKAEAPAEPVTRTARAPKAATAAQPDAKPNPAKRTTAKRAAKPKPKEGSAG
jgi:hypothetical protein